MNSLPDSRRVLRRRSRTERRVTLLVKVLGAIVLAAIVGGGIMDFLGRVSAFTVIIVGAIFFTYIVYPPVRWLNKRMPLIVAILIVYLAIALTFAFGIAVVVPAFADDIHSLSTRVPQIVANMQFAIANPHERFLSRIPGVQAYLAKLPSDLVAFTQKYAGDTAGRVLSVILSAVTVVATLVVMPVISIYLMIEAEGLRDAFVAAIPPRARPKTLAVLHDLDGVLGGFIRGQLLVGLTIGTLISIALVILKVRYALVIGVLAGLFDLIPYVGAVVGFVPAVALALLDQGWQHALIVAAVFVAIFQIEGHFVAPRIVSDSVGLSPLTVIIAILIGGELGGIGGMFVSVPLAAMLRVFLLHAIPEYGQGEARRADAKVRDDVATAGSLESVGRIIK